MATATQVFRESQKTIVLLAERELASFYNSLDPEKPLVAVRALEQFMPALIQEYGQMGAVVAAEFYEGLRAESSIRTPYRTLVGDGIPEEQARISTKWAVGPLFRAEANPAATLSNLTDVTDRLIKQRGRNTIHTNAQRDPAQARYARVPTGSETCAFCLMQASRGAVYATKESAAKSLKYHGKCDCVPTPVWDDNDLDRLKAENGYDPDEYYDRWQEALESEKDKA